MDNDETEASLDAYFHALAVSLGSDDGSEEAGARLLQHILRYIDAHLAEPSLSPAEVASATGISLRHLHRVFSATDCTMGDYVRRRRLKQCRKDMMDSRFRQRTITEIAFSWGFSDTAHFSHAFRKQFGTSPRALRSDPPRSDDDFSQEKSTSPIEWQPN